MRFQSGSRNSFGQKINVLDYYEAQGQELSVHLAWLRSLDWGKAWVILLHDGAHGDKVFATSYESARSRL
jgi:phage terminase large subunit